MSESHAAELINCAAEFALATAIVLGIGAGLWALARCGRRRFSAERRGQSPARQ